MPGAANTPNSSRFRRRDGVPANGRSDTHGNRKKKSKAGGDLPVMRKTVSARSAENASSCYRQRTRCRRNNKAKILHETAQPAAPLTKLSTDSHKRKKSGTGSTPYRIAPKPCHALPLTSVPGPTYPRRSSHSTAIREGLKPCYWPCRLCLQCNAEPENAALNSIRFSARGTIYIRISKSQDQLSKKSAF